MQRGKSCWTWAAALIGVAGLCFLLSYSRQAGGVVASEQVAAIGTSPRVSSQLVSVPSDVTAASEESPATVIDVALVPGGSVIKDNVVINDAPVGAEGVGEILADTSRTELDRGKLLARIALNISENDEVRQEALEQWLKMIPEEGASILLLLAKDARLDDNMKIMLLKDAISRGACLQVGIAYQMLGGASEDVNGVSKAILVKMLGKDYGSAKSDWEAAVHAFLAPNID